jgi:hypothetical protein
LFSQPDESKRDEKTLELTIRKSRAKELKRCLSSQSQVFLGLDESKADKADTQTYPGLFSWLG